MNLKKIVKNLIEEIRKDGKLGEQFEKEPVKVIENVVGRDLPDEVVEKIIAAVKANVNIDKATDAMDNLDDALDKFDLDKIDMDKIANVLDKADDIAKALKKFF